MGIETKEIEVTYGVWSAMYNMDGIKLYSSYSDPDDKFGTGIATMETKWNFGDEYIPVLRSKISWEYDQELPHVRRNVVYKYYLTIPIMVEDEDMYDYPNASGDGC